jgi:hypothetical protein
MPDDRLRSCRMRGITGDGVGRRHAMWGNLKLASSNSRRVGRQLPGTVAAVSLLLLTLALTTGSVQAAGPEAKEIEFFEAKIRPVLVELCYRCHSADAQAKKKLRGGLQLDTREGIRKGGDSGPAIVPGDAKKSLLLQAMARRSPTPSMWRKAGRTGRSSPREFTPLRR